LTLTTTLKVFAASLRLTVYLFGANYLKKEMSILKVPNCTTAVGSKYFGVELSVLRNTTLRWSRIFQDLPRKLGSSPVKAIRRTSHFHIKNKEKMGC
jgi:hypothetical protein